MISNPLVIFVCVLVSFTSAGLCIWFVHFEIISPAWIVHAWLRSSTTAYIGPAPPRSTISRQGYAPNSPASIGNLHAASL